MCTGAAFYHTGRIGPSEALEIGCAFFESTGIRITSAGYYEYLENGDHEGDHDIKEVSFDKLKALLDEGKASAFWLYNQQGLAPWNAAFEYQTGGFGSFPHMAAFCDIGIDRIYGRLTGWMRQTAERVRFPYGILYTAENMTAAFYYAAGYNFTTMFTTENGFAFNRETPGLYNGQARYVDKMLRMAYPCNLLNAEHLKIDLGGIALGDWIQADRKHGVFSRVREDLWMWEVEAGQLEEVNRILGEAGVLVAWRPPQPKKPRRKLP
ncbi:hypothetical protein NYE48_11685 [Paenibacillus sp. FSL M7-1455]|jgi:hypothetical protein|uniref:Uncharacterized protein n=1 Tax=Paenibacillus cookii TaxID=157839 RepID=A0ABQ4LRZ5_9BACL|nr:hypothetical protein [Paenibacillus cookii]GIO65923.1 hypothetical protein J21TS3_07440 [Paenibacillus cookii]